MTIRIQAFLKCVKRACRVFCWPPTGERKAVFAIVAAAVLLSALPMALIFLNRGTGQYVTGFEKRSSDDLAVYFSYIDQAKRGALLSKDMFTPEEEIVGTFNPVWWTIGRAARIFGLPAQYAFHVFRIALVPALIVSIYYCVSFFLKDTKDRRTALLLAAFGGGLGGWLAPHLATTTSVFGRFNAPLDVFVTEFSVFLSILYSPHFILSWICFILSAVFIIFSFETLSLKKSVLAGLLGLAFFSFHPYYAPFLFVFTFLLFILAAIRFKTWQKPILIFATYIILAFPPVLYHVFLIVSDYVVMARAQQNQTWSPAIIMTIISLGFFLPFSIIGAAKIKKDFRSRALLVWVCLHPVFLYLPWASQRRFVEGWILPLSILTVYGLKELCRHLRPLLDIFSSFSRKFVLAALFFLVFAYSNYCVLSGNIRSNFSRGAPVYLENNFFSAVKFLENTPGDTVMAPLEDARFIPYLSGKKVYAGHWAETLFSAEKSKLVKEFYSEDAADSWRKEILIKNKVEAVFWGESEKSLGGWYPGTSDFFKQAYKNDGYEVFVLKD